MKSFAPSEEKWNELRIAYADAMWQWAMIEAEIFTIYVAALKALKRDLRPLRAAFFATQSFEVKLAMVTAAAQKTFGPRRLKVWSALAKRCRDEQTKRGKIAHLTGYCFPPKKPGQPGPVYVVTEPLWHRAHPPDWGTAKSQGYDAFKLRQLHGAWYALDIEIGRFAKQLWGKLPLPVLDVQQARQRRATRRQ
ncbi:MAG TPA: hypothetical protein VGU20_03375 [Stellaceae bacterium]|nr:hypothetical protein [Stellaceae bacterium]